VKNIYFNLYLAISLNDFDVLNSHMQLVVVVEWTLLYMITMSHLIVV